ncbi:MAG: amidophosphoribosyltransferase [Eubacteriales bacterium]
MSNLREECGVFGIYAPEKCDVAGTVYYGLYALQHRGQESCGIVVNDDGIFNSVKDSGLVNDVFTNHRLSSLGEGRIAIGHCRYGKNVKNDVLNAQPIVVNHVKGHMALCFNGSLVNSAETREKLELEGSIFQTTSDAEIISNIIIRERLNSSSIEESVSRAMPKLEGAYSLIIMSPRKLIAAKDIHGIRPLCYGIRSDGAYVVASESCALDSVGAELVREIEPGEIVVFDEDGVRSIKDHVGEAAPAFCVFEYIYFARPDSVIDGFSVNRARERAGAFLALEHPVDADVVIGVPDSGIDAAIGYAHQSGIPYEIGFIKNKYIGRTFIAPGQQFRENLVRIKLNVISEVVRGKRVVLVDDSIVRGTTCARIVDLLRQAGATEVHLRSSAPPFIDLCYYGTDIDSKDNLIACRHTVDEIKDIIGVDSLGYLSVENVTKLAPKKCPGFCTACFDSRFPTAVPGCKVESKFSRKLSESAEVVHPEKN